MFIINIQLPSQLQAAYMALYQRALSTPSPGGADTRVDSLRRTLQVSNILKMKTSKNLRVKPLKLEIKGHCLRVHREKSLQR